MSLVSLPEVSQRTCVRARSYSSGIAANEFRDGVIRVRQCSYSSGIAANEFRDGVVIRVR